MSQVKRPPYTLESNHKEQVVTYSSDLSPVHQRSFYLSPNEFAEQLTELIEACIYSS